LFSAAAACGGINVAQPHDAGSDVESIDAPEERFVDVPDVVTIAEASTNDVKTLTDAAPVDVTTADVTTADVTVDAPPPFTPVNIQSKLAFWFDPSSLVPLNGLVTKWSDRSGNGNDAVQAITSYEPVYTPSGIGGLASATFTGPITFLAIADVPSMQWGTSDFFILAVVRANANTAGAAMIYQKTGPSPFDGASLYLNANKPVATTLCAAQVSGAAGQYVVSLPPPSTYVNSTVHVLGALRTGNTLEIRVDGQVSNTLTNSLIGTTNVSSAGLAAIIGQNGYGTPSAEFQQVHGDIAEMIGVRGSLDPATVANLEQYLKGRYGVP
jgi:hypothetical protein